MLLWLEEAAIEAAMILAVAIGVFMFVAAVYSLVHDYLHPEAARRREQAPAQSTEASGARRGLDDQPRMDRPYEVGR
jgi:hypothetical protein